MTAQESSLDFHQLFKIIPGLYIVLLPDLTVVAVSDDYLRATMVKREDLVGKHIFDVFPENPEDGESHSSANVRESFEKVFQTGEPDVLPIQKYDVQRPAEEGGGFEERFWKLATFPAFDNAGNVAYIIHHVEDITEQVKLKQEGIQKEKINAALEIRANRIESERNIATDALEDARLRLESALKAGEIGTWTWDVVNNRVVADENLAKLFSVSTEEAEGGQVEKFTDKIHPDDRERVGNLIKEALQNADSYEAEYRLVKPDDSFRWVVARGSVLRDEAGNPMQLPGVVIDISERKRSEEELRESKSRLALALQAGRAGTFEWDIKNDVNIWSPELEELYGVPAGTFEKNIEAWTKRVAAEDAEKVLSGVQAALEKHEKNFDYEFRAIMPDGSHRLFAGRARFEYDADNQPLKMIGINVDISERKEIEKKLRTSDERFQLVTRATNDAIWDWNLQTNEVWWNNAVQTMFGYTSEQIESNSEWWYEHIHPEDRERIVEGIHAVIDNGGENWSDEYRYLCADGSYKYVFDRGFAIHQNSQPTRMLGAMQDITARREAEEALRQSQERLQLVLDASQLGLWYCDLPFDVLNWSDLTKSHFWLPPEATVTIDDFYNIMHPEDRAKTRAEIDFSIESRTHYDVEYRTVNPQNNAIKWIRAIGRGFYDNNNNPYRFDGITIDITQDKQINAELERLLWSEKNARTEAENANRLKDDFLATLSHELRTPLSSILGWSRMLKDGQLKDEQVRRAVETIERNAKSQSQLIEDILDVSRIVSGKLRLNVQTVDLASTIEMAIESVRPAADAKNIRLQRVLDSGVMISGDADRLQQVVWNVISNAIKFTPKEGFVQIKLERVDSHVEIIVTDNGQGIDAESLPFIFERFRQSDSSTTRTHGGLGLGLAIVRHLVELHGGTVHAASKGLNEGAAFTVKFPLISLRSTNISLNNESETDEKIPADEKETNFTCPSEIKNLRVLMVDDEPDTRDLLVFVFESCEAKVTSVSSVVEALEAIKTDKFDVLVSDIGMPERDGYDLIKTVRQLSPEQGGRIPAVALTAYARVEDRLKALSAGFQMHVPKPVEPAELLAVVASLAVWNNQNSER